MCCYSDRFFHQNLNGREAEQRMLSVNSLVGTFLVRKSTRQPDSFVLSIVVLEKKTAVLHVMITFQVDFHSKIGLASSFVHVIGLIPALL